MAYQDLREFIRALEKNGELKRIAVEADPRLEITEFADRAVKRGGPALLFEHPKGSSVPVLINAFASMRKMEIALEVKSVEEVAARIVEFLEMRMPEGLIGKLKMLPKLAEMGAFFPKVVSRGPCQEVVRTEGFSLFDFPVLQCWPGDCGRFQLRWYERSGGRRMRPWFLSRPLPSRGWSRPATVWRRRWILLKRWGGRPEPLKP